MSFFVEIIKIFFLFFFALTKNSICFSFVFFDFLYFFSKCTFIDGLLSHLYQTSPPANSFVGSHKLIVSPF